MKTFYISGKMTISVQTVVRAEDEDQAIEIAEGRSMIPLYNKSSRDRNEGWVPSGDIAEFDEVEPHFLSVVATASIE
jgi:hypothetical protein